MVGRDFPGKGKVAVLRTRPETVLEDVGRLMDMAGYRRRCRKTTRRILKINISWQTWYPACSSTPWQIEGVVRKLQADGYRNLAAAHNKTVVVDAYVGERNNKQKIIVDKYGVRNVHLYEPEIEWVRYMPKAPMLVLDRVFPEGILIPEFFFDNNIIHLPTVKTHVFTMITGAMKNAFGGLLNEKRHWTHGVIHETVVDLLAIQQEIHSGLFAVMDGTFAGDGPGPRAMRWHEKDILLASADQVAIDAISAKLQGFNPMDLKFIRLAHELGLGCGRSQGDRDRRRGHLGRGLGLRPGGYLREPRSEDDLSRRTKAVRKPACCARRSCRGATLRRISITTCTGIRSSVGRESRPRSIRSGVGCSSSYGDGRS